MQLSGVGELQKQYGNLIAFYQFLHINLQTEHILIELLLFLGWLGRNIIIIRSCLRFSYCYSKARQKMSMDNTQPGIRLVRVHPGPDVHLHLRLGGSPGHLQGRSNLKSVRIQVFNREAKFEALDVALSWKGGKKARILCDFVKGQQKRMHVCRCIAGQKWGLQGASQSQGEYQNGGVLAQKLSQGMESRLQIMPLQTAFNQAADMTWGSVHADLCWTERQHFETTSSIEPFLKTI